MLRHVNDTFYTQQVGELQKFGSFLDNIQALSLKKEIKDSNGNILVQAKRPLTPAILKALSSREEDNDFHFDIELSDGLKAAINSRVVKEMNRRLDLSDFSFAGYLLDKERVNVSRIVAGAMKNDFFMSYLIMLLYEQKPIIDHVFEVALTCLGMLATAKPGKIQPSELTRIFQAAILHDFSISQSVQWEGQEDFRSDTNHDFESAKALGGKGLDPAVALIIQRHNKLQRKYVDANRNESWFTDNVELSTVILNLVEYFTYLKRDVIQRTGGDENEMSVIFYEIALEAEKGFFPAPMIEQFENFFSKYAEFFSYGKEIGIVENKCPHGPYALAYPKPKSTQVLCKNSAIPCPHRYSGKQLHVVRAENDLTVRFGEPLMPDWYDKCAFSEELPKPPDIF